MSRVHVLTEPDWHLTEQPINVQYRPDVGMGWRRGYPVDPFPCYHHDPDVVAAALRHCEQAFPLPEPFTPNVYLLAHESLSRTNGSTDLQFDHSEEFEDSTQRPWTAVIVLSGKRIPPHPALTRYLVAHEYGHVVEDWLIRLRHEAPQTRDLLNEYAAVRGLAPEPTSGAHTWHLSWQEIFACDFRIARTGLETEFWPHEGVPRPESIPAIMEWWREAGSAPIDPPGPEG